MNSNFYENIRVIDKVLSKESITNQIFKLIEEEYYANYFFKKAKSIVWFMPLKEKGYFSPSKIKFDNEGNALFWNVLDYLERISEHIKENPKKNKQYAAELFNIIDETVKCSKKRKKENKKPINHYHIWWYFIKIINNIPAVLIKEHVSSEQFRKWLVRCANFTSDNSLVISDVGMKLLGKFLEDESMILYAEIIINIITEIRTGKKKHLEDSILAWDPYWILKSFEKYNDDIARKCSDTIIYNLSDKLKRALEYKQKKYHINIELDNNFYRLEVLRISKEEIKKDEIAFKKDHYEGIIWQYTNEQIKNIDVEKDFWALHRTKPNKKLKQFHFKAEDKGHFLYKFKEKLPTKVKWEKLEDFEKKLTDLFDGLFEDYSQVWFKSLASGGSTHSNQSEEILTIILRNLMLDRCEKKEKEVISILKTFLSSEYPFPIFKKFVLLCVDRYWNDYRDLFKEFIMTYDNALDKTDWEVELQDVLNNHNKEFDESITDKLMKLIKNIPEYYRKKKDDQYAAYWQYKWLSPLKDNPKFSGLYNKVSKKVEKSKPFKPNRSAFKGGFVKHKSPLTVEEILEMPNDKLVEYLNRFEGSKRWEATFEGKPDKKGLAEELKNAVKERPNKFTDKLKPFLQCKYLYVYSIIRGLKDALSDNKSLDWSDIFSFIKKYINKENLLKEAKETQRDDIGEGKYIWIVDAVMGLISIASNKNEESFANQNFDIINGIFDKSLSLVKGEEKPEIQRDAVTYALNTSLGKVIESFIIFSLCVARIKEEKESSWGNNKYNCFFEKGIEAYIWFGHYLPNLKYIDKKWTEEKIEEFNKLSAKEIEWQMFMNGYLVTRYVYEDLYKLMRNNYKKAIESKTFDNYTDKRLVQHIAIGYLRGYDTLEKSIRIEEESLFLKMLEQIDMPEKRDRWIEVINFFWAITKKTIRKEEKEEKDLSPEFKNKILDFWEWTYKNKDEIKERLDDKYETFLGKIAELTLLLDKIGKKEYEWLMESAPYINLHRNATFFIEYLTKFEDGKSIKTIGRIFRKVLENITPTFREDDIKLLVERIYEKGDKKDADAICNTYGKRGIHFLKDLYFKNNK